MAVLCIILNQADKNEVEGGAEKGYLNNSQLHPVRRQGGTSGNPEPCYILNTVVLTNPDFATAAPYLSGLTQKWSDAEDFPPVYEPSEE
jgi:hypothetical protein